MTGHTFKRCGCRDPETGKQLGARCPKLSRRSHGRWWARYQAPGPRNGKRIQPTLGPFNTEREAQAALGSVLERINRGTYVELDRQTFSDYLDQWLNGKAKLKAATRRSYETHIRLYLRPGLGHLELSALRDHDFEELYGAMRLIGRLAPGGRRSHMLTRLLDARTDTPQAQRPLSPAQIRRVHSTVMSALNSAVRRRKLAHNPAQYLELESGKAPRALVWTTERVAQWRSTGRRPSAVMVWTPAQTAAFLVHVEPDRLYPLWHLIAHRGLRRGEAVHLLWADVDLDAGQATIREQADERRLDAQERRREPDDRARRPHHRCSPSPPGRSGRRSARPGARHGSTRAASSRRRTARPSTPTRSPSASTAWSSATIYRRCGCTT